MLVIGLLLAREPLARLFNEARNPARSLPISGRVVAPKLTDLVTIDVAAGKSTSIFTYGQAEAVSAAAWSPDHRSIVIAFYHRHAGENASSGELYLIDPDGSNLRPLVGRARPGDVMDTPVWAPDGQSIYFSAAGLEQSRPFQRIQRATLNGQLTTLVEGALGPDISPDGRYLTFLQDQRGDLGLSVMDLTTGAARSIVAPGTYPMLAGPRFSPDGQKIAVAIMNSPLASPSGDGPFGWLLPSAAYAHGNPWDIWTVPVSGGEPTRLTNVNADDPYPIWSPDGQFLAYWSITGLSVFPVTGGGVAQVTTEGGYGSGGWIP
ncbi:MAG: PD40 domain-containing protein [Chloroflexi bacterium]|nr:PD40 domain-containing protein [Chloroflexota bacterium]